MLVKFACGFQSTSYFIIKLKFKVGRSYCYKSEGTRSKILVQENTGKR